MSTYNGSGASTLGGVLTSGVGHTGVAQQGTASIALGGVVPSVFSRSPYLGPVGVLSQVSGVIRQGGGALFQFNGKPRAHVVWENLTSLVLQIPPIQASLPMYLINMGYQDIGISMDLHSGLPAGNVAQQTLVENMSFPALPVLAEVSPTVYGEMTLVTSDIDSGVSASVSGQVCYSLDEGGTWAYLPAQALLLKSGSFVGPTSYSGSWSFTLAPGVLANTGSLLIAGLLKGELATGGGGLVGGLFLTGTTLLATDVGAVYLDVQEQVTFPPYAVPVGGTVQITGMMKLSATGILPGTTASVSGQVSYSVDNGVTWTYFDPNSLVLIDGVYDGASSVVTAFSLPFTQGELPNLDTLKIVGLLGCELTAGGLDSTLALVHISVRVQGVNIGVITPQATATDDWGRAYALYSPGDYQGPIELGVSYGS